MKVVIMAGGKGTRISSVASDIPKPMVKIAGVPVLEREILSMREQGFRDFIITVGHLKKIIMDYFGDGSKIGVHIDYFEEEIPLGNAGALFRLKDKLTDDFLLLNADAVFDIDFNRLVNYHKQKGGLVTLFTHPNSHPYDSGLIVADGDGVVTKWMTKQEERPKYYKNRANAGIHVISPEVLRTATFTEKVDLDKQILKPLAGTGKMFCYDSPEYVKDMGTPERYGEVCSDFLKGIVTRKNLKKEQKAFFLDRDGTINKYVGFLNKTEQFELLPGVAAAIRKINESGYLAIVVTNQPVVARGEATIEKLEEIHNKMETLLGFEGAYLDGVYFCPHHPDKGYKGEISALKLECECRKPKPGMILKAAQKFNIDLSKSWMIGDSAADIQAGQAAGTKTALIGEKDFKQDLSGQSLLDIVNEILG